MSHLAHLVHMRTHEFQLTTTAPQALLTMQVRTSVDILRAPNKTTKFSI